MTIERFIFDAPAGRVVTLAGVASTSLTEMLETSTSSRIALVLRLNPSRGSIRIDDVLDGMANAALSMWPVWYDGCDFGHCSNDTAGRTAAQSLITRLATRLPALSGSWATTASSHALAGQVPRAPSVPADVELFQLCYAINPPGLVLVFDFRSAPWPTDASAVIHTLEWIARTGRCGVVVLVEELPPNRSPFDRILYGAKVATAPIEQPEVDERRPSLEPVWLGLVRGRPHPLSTEERRITAALLQDSELCALFSFNQVVETVHGGKPKVDILWRIGRLVIEVDGYSDHATRTAFMSDRQRDYELLLSGYTVLRLANDEVRHDLQRVVEKIRSVVRYRRGQVGIN